MQVSCRFQNQTHDFCLPQDANLGILMEEINRKLSIPQEQMKFIFRGKPLSTPLEALTNGMKLLLMAAEPPQKVKESQQRTRTGFFSRPSIIDTLKEPVHMAIINRGPPGGILAASKFDQMFFPREKLYTWNTKGERASLDFESDAVFSINDEGTPERIFMSDILAFKLIPIASQPGYEALGMMTRSGNRWFYFVPGQLVKLITKVMAQ